MSRNKSGVQGALNILLFVAIIAGILWFVFKYALFAFMPFIISWLFALAVYPAVKYINRKSGFPKKIIALFLVLIISAFAVTLVLFLGEKLLIEVSAFVERLSANADRYADSLLNILSGAKKRFGFLEGIDDKYFTDALLGVIKEGALRIAGELPGIAARCIELLPNILFSAVIFILSAVYVTAELDKINAFFVSMLPSGARESVKKCADVLKKTGGRYIRSYAVIFLITFTELLTGFLILEIKYEFTLALIIALIDLLPVIGVGTALIPWSIVLILSGNYYKGFGLLILFGVSTIIRQITEPKIVSDNVGLPPIVTLTAMYAGFRFLGVAGILVMPFAAVLIKSLNEAGVIRLWKNAEEKELPPKGKQLPPERRQE